MIKLNLSSSKWNQMNLKNNINKIKIQMMKEKKNNNDDGWDK